MKKIIHSQSQFGRAGGAKKTRNYRLTETAVYAQDPQNSQLALIQRLNQRAVETALLKKYKTSDYAAVIRQAKFQAGVKKYSCILTPLGLMAFYGFLVGVAMLVTWLLP